MPFILVMFVVKYSSVKPIYRERKKLEIHCESIVHVIIACAISCAISKEQFRN